MFLCTTIYTDNLNASLPPDNQIPVQVAICEEKKVLPVKVLVTTFFKNIAAYVAQTRDRLFLNPYLKSRFYTAKHIRTSRGAFNFT